MLEDLKFVQGAVAKKDFLPALTHFVIEDGTVKGFNGTIALCSPIPFDISCKPKADALVKAIASCDHTVSLSLTPAGRLSVVSGKFKAFVDCVDGATPHAGPEGEFFDIDGEKLLQAMRVCMPFVSDDASRPWSNGVLFLGQSAFATNNVTLVEYWTGFTMQKPVNIPRAAIKEMLRLGVAPSKAQMSETSITFHYDGGRWLRTQLYQTDWPDLTKVLNKESNPVDIDPKLFEALQTVKPFCDKMGRIIIKGDIIATHHEDTEGASFEVPGLNCNGVYQIDMLNLLSTAKKIDWTMYPSACMFFGDRLRGAIIGMKQ